MTKTILAAVLTLSFAGAALAEGEGYATTGDWREVKVTPTASAQVTSKPVPAPAHSVASFQFNEGLNG